MDSGLQFEICIDSVDGALAAQEGGAHRVELCDALSVGGTTPSAGMIRQVRAVCDLPVHVLIRPRSGDFIFSPAEWSVMESDVELAKGWGVQGVVIGGLKADGSIDVDGCARLAQAAGGLSVTFHRAIDVCEDAPAAIRQLAEIGVNRVLTSGQAATAWAGRDMIRRLVEAAQEQVVIMAGAGITEENAAQLVKDTQVDELHFSARRRRQLPTPRTQAQMGADAAADAIREETDPDRIRQIIAAAKSGLG